MTNSRKLDRKIVVEEYSETANEFNEPEESWTPHTSPRAEIIDVSDKEKQSLGRTGSARISRFTIRYSSKAKEITSAFRLQYDGDVWNILGVKAKNERRKRFIEILATTGSD